MPKKDITQREDIQLLVDSFYEKVLKDNTIGYIFTDVAKLNVPEHMPIMYDFWSSVLLGTSAYKGNPMDKHFALNEKEPLQKKHFDRWLELWLETVDELFEGETAREAKTRASTIGTLMLFKMEEARK
ncbi:group III truncated hemoglobin [Marivirga sp.]|uniref:group III truncated hemoglobin n=1 Tax=Marivirga sp. TaxID=2018662 RepID=UPI002D800323|nr:group III truncated hemoglobin [Marivirga sp.]HET8860295.1 group III truncated hemoglobin [Marivirga sp.]